MKKLYTVTMSNGDTYGIPAELIAENRANYYQMRGDSDYRDDMEIMMHWFDTQDYDFADWAKNNMDWDDVKDKAILISQADIAVDYQDGWVNGKHGFMVQEISR